MCANSDVGAVCVAATCSDFVLNGDETDVDCGGATCGKCAALDKCKANSDCASDVCTDGSKRCALAASCTDGVKNGDETCIDGGGSCSPCQASQSCSQSSDCATGLVCSFGVCAVSNTFGPMIGALATGSGSVGGVSGSAGDSGAVVVAAGGPYVTDVTPSSGPSPGQVTVAGGRFLYSGSASFRMEFSSPATGAVLGVGACTVGSNSRLSCAVPSALGASVSAAGVVQVQPAAGQLWTPVGTQAGDPTSSTYTVTYAVGVPVALQTNTQPGSAVDGAPFGVVRVQDKQASVV